MMGEEARGNLQSNNVAWKGNAGEMAFSIAPRGPDAGEELIHQYSPHPGQSLSGKQPAF